MKDCAITAAMWVCAALAVIAGVSAALCDIAQFPARGGLQATMMFFAVIALYFALIRRMPK